MTQFWTSLAIAGSIVIAFMAYMLWASGGDVTGWIYKIEELTASLDRAGQELQACHGEGQPCPVSRRNGCDRCADKLTAYRQAKRDALGALSRPLLILGAIGAALLWLCYPLSFKHMTLRGLFGIGAVSFVAGAITAALEGDLFAAGLTTSVALGCLAGASLAPPRLPVRLRRRRPPRDDPS